MQVTEQIYHQVADLLNLRIDLLFFDTTSTYFQTSEPDDPVARDQHGRRAPDPQAVPADDVRDVGFRTHGKNKDHRDDLPQVIIGMAVTREPVRTPPGGLLRIDQAAIKAERRLDGKYLLRCSDPKLSAEDIAIGDKIIKATASRTTDDGNPADAPVA